jgi:hypothetical protein
MSRKTYLGVLEPHPPPGLCSCRFEGLPHDRQLVYRVISTILIQLYSGQLVTEEKTKLDRQET